MLNIGNIDAQLKSFESLREWQRIVAEFKEKPNIVLVGHGGNLAIADHMAVDITRLTKYTKATFSPGSAINATSFINDSSFDDWLVCWFRSLNLVLNPENTFVIGISSSGKSSDVLRLLEYCDSQSSS